MPSIVDLLRPFARILALAGVVAGLFTWFTIEQRAKGAQGAIKKVERANDKAAKAAGSAGAKSLSGTGGVRNPNYRD